MAAHLLRDALANVTIRSEAKQSEEEEDQEVGEETSDHRRTEASVEQPPSALDHRRVALGAEAQREIELAIARRIKSDSEMPADLEVSAYPIFCTIVLVPCHSVLLLLLLFNFNNNPSSFE